MISFLRMKNTRCRTCYPDKLSTCSYLLSVKEANGQVSL